MAITQEAKDYYDSGFRKEVQRGKYNLKINERLKLARNRKGLSAKGVVKALAKRGIEIGHSSLQGYEADETSLNHRYPSLPVLIHLADFYGCSVDYLLGVTDRFRSQTITTREVDLRDLLESKKTLAYNSSKLNKVKRDFLINQLDTIVADLN